MAADLITIPFADQGDKTAPPNTDPSGFVNLTEGYTRYYEISLESGDPQAKAVERAIQNYMFNMLSSNVQLWQKYSIAPWYPAMSGGYSKNAIVLRSVSGVMVPFRSLVDLNSTDPNGNPASWEYVRTWAEISSKIPMPSGGLNGAAELITVTTNLNTLDTGTYEIATDALATLCAAPISPFDTVARSGMIECKTWIPGVGLTAAIQRYTNRLGVEFARGMYGGVWSGWTPQISTPSQGDIISYAVDTGVANAINISTALSPVLTARTDGAVFKIKVKVANTGATTINDGIGTVPLVGKAAPLQGGELTANGEAWVQWNTSIGAAPGSYILMANSAGGFPVGPATKSQHALQLGQATGRFVKQTLFTGAGSSTWTKDPATTSVFVEVYGGGGGGGGVAATSGNLIAAAGGGGGGGYSGKFIPNVVSPQTVTRGAGGAGNLGNGPGGAGGTSSFGSYCTASGGGGGSGCPAGGQAGVQGGIGGTGSGGDVNLVGNAGGASIGATATNAIALISGFGGGAAKGAGGAAGVASTTSGLSGNDGGGGGSGAGAYNSGALGGGGTGGFGFVIVTEYT